jgi:uncharacterized protein YprB with RNaseH-like and TPR domain
MREGGYAFICDPVEGIREASTFTCVHCNTVVHVKPKTNPDEFGSMCRLCMKMVCRHCANLGCTPFEKKLEMMEKRDIALRSYGV